MDKWPDNVPGKIYVDETCIDCMACQEAAPNFFKRNDEHGYSFVYKQPESEADLENCNEALEACPVGAIGDNNAD